MYSISLCRTWSIIKLKRPKKDGVRCHLTKKSNEIINNNLFSVKFKKEKQTKERWSGLSFDEKIKSFTIIYFQFIGDGFMMSTEYYQRQKFKG